MFLGAHVSIAGGFDKCIDRIQDLGGNCLMTFASSPRSLQTRNFTPEEIESYITKKAKAKIGPHFLHAVYLVNLASASKAYVKTSVNSLIFYQRLAAKIGAEGTILHIGSRQNRDISTVFNQIVSSINFILDSSPKSIRLILENAAGQDGPVGGTFDDLAQIISRVGDKSKIGVCLDTQHAFAAGYPLEQVLDKFDRTIGLKHLSVVHFNDSLTEFGSHVDRHANLGEGLIGLEKMGKFIASLGPRTKTPPPIILEVPGKDHSGPRKSDLDQLKSLL